MASPALTWTLAPLLGGVIGYATNALAVKMIFRPARPVNVLGLRVQGLIGRRQADLARSMGGVVGDHLLRHEDVVRALGTIDLAGLLDEAFDKGLSKPLEELRAKPFVGAFLNDELVASLRTRVVQGVVESGAVPELIEKAVERGLDVRALVQEKVAAFPVETLERLVLEVARRELRSIEVLGGVLGVLVGLVQAALLTYLG